MLLQNNGLSRVSQAYTWANYKCFGQMTYKFTLKASKTRHQHCPTQFNLLSNTKHIVSDTEHFWALQDGFQLFKKMLFQSFQSGYNSSCSNDQKLQVICFANNPIPFIVTHWAWYSALLRYWTWCGKKTKGVIKVYVKSCNGGGKKTLFFFFSKQNFAEPALFYTFITDNSGATQIFFHRKSVFPSQIWQ